MRKRIKVVALVVMVSFFSTFCLASTSWAQGLYGVSRAYGRVIIPSETWGFGGRTLIQEERLGASGTAEIINAGGNTVAKVVLTIVGGIIGIKVVGSLLDRIGGKDDEVIVVPAPQQGQIQGNSYSGSSYESGGVREIPCNYGRGPIVASKRYVEVQPAVYQETVPNLPAYSNAVQTVSTRQVRVRPEGGVYPSLCLVENKDDKRHMDFWIDEKGGPCSVEPLQKTGVWLGSGEHYLRVKSYVRTQFEDEDEKWYSGDIERDSKMRKGKNYGCRLELKKGGYKFKK